MQCPNGCLFPMEERKEEKVFHRNGGEPVIVSGLIIYVCSNCGQESMPLSSARIVENILTERLKPSGKFTAELYEVSSGCKF
ncbi:hypothetical protein AUJ95_01260 [Candidatus Desantisbacteria bacterium CG2_30_40_21]|uniref:YgiT-type zinc finger domain-containing protein n=5 Tax=unclassified Candidatus Desantisiibacteriota TaxID=3106372 RepID=A0A2M7J8M7_9BACT|nr:MAG: hypothetical protein AUJ95_01260 [Candidatus Desantisbacteria bacterium CG2_30_40_21]PIP40588.1 MAG: hypothetical protein COX18_06240 [Candidatus Desantisbacteria bacterium CG23_combo_of_CG06-09_8_20_14_all_40_23]PIX15724.1 MAG: hypothetical protein COZ71_09665 [Candidatus Desantisbacteria bacterium CG_4_8_14_3_um_filter_40_12]PIY19765.1 MAG: hypothetical protein COZ13_03645 [Candidatus Desantisbacteria bacterium CG_4_10_14_3_um_filter_40_18]PJB28844.1 MAG: hypothetical protein CO110_08